MYESPELWFKRSCTCVSYATTFPWVYFACCCWKGKWVDWNCKMLTGIQGGRVNVTSCLKTSALVGLVCLDILSLKTKKRGKKDVTDTLEPGRYRTHTHTHSFPCEDIALANLYPLHFCMKSNHNQFQPNFNQTSVPLVPNHDVKSQVFVASGPDFGPLYCSEQGHCLCQKRP